MYTNSYFSSHDFKKFSKVFQRTTPIKLPAVRQSWFRPRFEAEAIKIKLDPGSFRHHNHIIMELTEEFRKRTFSDLLKICPVSSFYCTYRASLTPNREHQ